MRSPKDNNYFKYSRVYLLRILSRNCRYLSDGNWGHKIMVTKILAVVRVGVWGQQSCYKTRVWTDFR